MPTDTVAPIVYETETARPARRGRSAGDQLLISVLALLVWIGVVFLGRLWGIQLEAEGHRLILYTPPVLGGYRLTVPASLLLPLAVGALLVAMLPQLAHRWRWRGTLVLAAVTALGWWLALALVDGIPGLTDGLAWDAEMAGVEQDVVAHPASWLSGFTAGELHAGIQTRAHPPGLPLLLAGMLRWGMPGSGWAVAACLVGALLGVAAVLVVVRELAGEDVARSALPFVVLAPAAIWIATSFDALFMGVAAWFVACFVLACTRSGRTSDRFAFLAGALAAATIMLSYGLVLMGLLVVGIAVRRRAWRPTAIALGTAMGCILAFVPFGFWWLSGLGATKEAYYALGLDRPYPYFLLADIAALALVVGPAIAVALTRRQPPDLAWLLGGAVAAMVVADISGLSTGEVERIWLPFAVWLLPAAAVLGRRVWATRGWLVLQVGSALVLTALIRTYW